MKPLSTSRSRWVFANANDNAQSDSIFTLCSCKEHPVRSERSALSAQHSSP